MTSNSGSKGSDQQKGGAHRQEALGPLLRAAPIAIGLLRQRVVAQANDRLGEMTGYRPDEIIDQSMRMLYPDRAQFDQFGQEIHASIGRAGSASIETRWQRKDGRMIDVLLTLTALDRQDLALGVVFTALDITERKQTEGVNKHAIEKVLRKYRQMVESSTDYMALIDRHYVCQEINSSFHKILGRSRAAIVGHSASEIFGRSFFEKHHKPGVDRCLEGEEVQYKAWYNTPALGRRYIETDYYPSREDDGRISGVVIVGRDLTHLKKLESQLLQAQKLEAVGTLAAGVAHDFNNLLMGIQGRASLMTIEIEGGHPLREHVEAIETYVRNAADLTRQLLGFAQGGKYEIQPTNLNELVRNHNRMFSRTHKELRVQGTYAPDLDTVEVDRGQINQVLLNIYLNACQAMPEGGNILVETANVTLEANDRSAADLKPGRYVSITVSDTGVGMDEAVRQRVFEPFFTTRPMGRGTGLGLASAYGIVKNHGGTISLTSEKGRGTTFSIYLPSTGRTAQPAGRPSGDMQPGTGMVLLVDDEQLIIEVGTAMLAKLGYEVLTAGDGEDAITLYQQERERIAVVILDMVMPGMSGGETFDRLKGIDPEVKVLLSSGYGLDGQAREIIERGCVGFIQKPFSLIRLSKMLQAATTA